MKPYPKYKDSGLEWIGEVPEHWTHSELKFLLSGICNGTTATQIADETDFPVSRIETISTGQIDWNKVGHLREEDATDAYRLNSGDILLSHINSKEYVGNCAQYCAVRPLFHGMNLLRLEPKTSTVDGRYLLHLLKSNVVRVQERAICKHAINQVSIPMSDLKAIRVCFPSLEEQRRIALFLDAKTAQIDELIGKKRRQIELLMEYRASVISEAVTKGLNPNVRMKDSGLSACGHAQAGVEWIGQIPEHWEVFKVAHVVTKLTNGFVGPTRDILVDAGVRYIQSLHVKRNTIDFHKEYFVSQEWSDNHSRSILREGDVLVVQTGAIGEVAIVPKEFEGANCHALIIMTPDGRNVGGEFLLNLLRSNYGLNSLLSIQTGALHPHLNSTIVKDIKLTLPPPKEQDAINEFIHTKLSEVDSLVEKHEQAIESLQSYRTSLISEAVTGKIDVRDWSPD